MRTIVSNFWWVPLQNIFLWHRVVPNISKGTITTQSVIKMNEGQRHKKTDVDFGFTTTWARLMESVKASFVIVQESIKSTSLWMLKAHTGLILKIILLKLFLSRSPADVTTFVTQMFSWRTNLRVTSRGVRVFRVCGLFCNFESDLKITRGERLP